MATYIPNVQDILPEPKLYTPDFSFIDKMLKRKEAQYEQGFAQLNNQYNLINKDLTNPANVKYRDEFLKAAKNNLKDLSAMDLSEMQNVNSAVSIFKPFYSNTQVIQDQVLTDHWNKEEKVAESFRLKDGGKEFSPDNLNYIRMQRAAFAADDPSTVGKYAAQRRYYTPYYDYNKEIKEAMKDFKPSHTVVQSINGMYKVTVEDKSMNDLEIAKYLNAVLSDKAKQQMRIEGAVRLGSDEHFLLNHYMETEAPKLESLTKVIDDYDAKIKTEKDPDKLVQLKENREYYDSQRAEISSNLRSLRSGDMSFLKENSENLAYNTYYEAIVNKFSDGYSNKDISQKIDGDEVGMMYFKEAAADRRQQQSLAAEWERMLYKNEQDWQRTMYTQGREDDRKRQEILATYGGPGVPVAGRKMGTVDNSAQALGVKIQDASAIRQNAYMDLCEHIITLSGSKFTTLDQLDTPEGKAYVNQFLRQNMNDQKVQGFLQASANYSNAQSALINHTTTFYTNLQQTLGAKNFNILRTYEKALSKNGGNVSAAIAATGASASTIQSLLKVRDQARANYESDAKTKVGVSDNGIMVSKTSKVYQNTVGYFNQLIEDKDILGLSFFPQTSAGTFDISVGVTGKTAEILDAGGDDANKLKERYKTIFGKPVEYDKATKQIVFMGIGNNMASTFDPLINIPGYERSVLGSIINTKPAPGEQSAPGTFWIKDGGVDGRGTAGKQRVVQIFTKNDVTYVKVDNVIWQPSTGNWGDVGTARIAIGNLLSQNTTQNINNVLNKK